MNEEHKEYLDELRGGGDINMFAASGYLMTKFDMNKDEAREVLIEWMGTF